MTLRLCRGIVAGAPPSPYTRPQECPKTFLKKRTWYQSRKHVCAKARLRNPDKTGYPHPWGDPNSDHGLGPSLQPLSRASSSSFRNRQRLDCTPARRYYTYAYIHSFMHKYMFWKYEFPPPPQDKSTFSYIKRSFWDN